MCVGTLVCGTLDTYPVGRFRHCCCRSDYRVVAWRDPEGEVVRAHERPTLLTPPCLPVLEGQLLDDTTSFPQKPRVYQHFLGYFDHAAKAYGIAALLPQKLLLLLLPRLGFLLLLMLSAIKEEAARHTHCSMVSTFTYDKPEFCVFRACRCCCCCEVHDTLQYHNTALMPLHSLSVLCRTLMLNGLALVHS